MLEVRAPAHNLSGKKSKSGGRPAEGARAEGAPKDYFWARSAIRRRSARVSPERICSKTRRADA